jgi:hypothetical protein
LGYRGVVDAGTLVAPDCGVDEKEMAMRIRSVLLSAVALAGVVVAGASASAQPLDKGHFDDAFTDTFDCNGTPAQVDGTAHVNFTFVRHGSGFAYYRESVKATNVYTNLNNGGTYTEIDRVNSHDAKVTDNGDGTLTIVIYATGSAKYYDTHGKLVLKDPGQLRFQILVDDNGTPFDPFDDEEIDGSFQVVRESTGRNDTEGRDFCEDLVIFTS